MGKYDGILLASDLDGTLLDSARTVSRQNAQAIKYFMAEGGRFTPATGRSLHGFMTVEPMVLYNTPCVLFNGSCVYDFKAKEAVRTVPLRGDYVQACRDALMMFPSLPLEVHNLDGTYVYRANGNTDSHFDAIGAGYIPVKSLDDIPKPWLKALFCDDTPVLRRVQMWLRRRYADVFDCVFSHKYLLELQDPDANKGAQIAYIADGYGIHRVYAVGDGENDLSMTRFDFYAPRNADPAVKRAARGVVADNDGHAVARMIDIIDREA